jgi:glutamate formiminotransferase
MKAGTILTKSSRAHNRPTAGVPQASSGRPWYTLDPVPQLECVPNVSEGRSPEVVAELFAAVSSVPGVRLLDASSDPDHNRSVLTLAGEPDALHEGLLALYEVALREIDLNRHQGVHPRVGAVDVTPFVPLAGTSMAVAVAAAERLGAAVAERFGLAVYLYEQAARVPERRRLADIRRGGFEGFPARLSDPAWAPDYGPARVHPTAGVTVIGARFFLIAFNVVLETADLAVARAIASRVREAGGGLQAVRAMGVSLERVRREAEAEGTRVLETEVVGLVPEAAVWGTLREALQCPVLGGERALEERLRVPG